jgi:acyl carrier protein
VAGSHSADSIAKSTAERVLGVLADIFPAHRAALTVESSADTVSDWDSMHTIHIAMGLEAEFGVQLDPEEIATLQSTAVILTVLAAHGIS